MKPKKKIIVSVTNDLSFDQRVDKVCNYLTDIGFEVLLVGRKLKSSIPIQRNYKTKRMKLFFNKGALFYAEYNIRLFIFLIFNRSSLLLSNDLDTLLANYLAHFFYRRNLIYDSHEYFTEVPEIQNKKTVKFIWESIEHWIFPKLNDIYTVNDSIASLYQNKYQKNVSVVRNIAVYNPISIRKSREELGLKNDKFYMILQGSGINIDRGGEEAVLSLKQLPMEVELLIVGSGDAIPVMKKIANEENLLNRITFVGKIPYKELMQYTINSDVGLTLDKASNLNYKFSLPNKVFDYIHAGIPVISSSVVEVKKIVENFEVGITLDEVTPSCISEATIKLFHDDELRNKFKQNTLNASKSLTWQNETRVLDAIYLKYLK